MQWWVMKTLLTKESSGRPGVAWGIPVYQTKWSKQIILYDCTQTQQSCHSVK